MNLIVLIISLTTIASTTSAHAIHVDMEADRQATYAELHMASEHHMDNFDIQSFFHLHDLNGDKVLDVNELESVYGVHHEKSKKESGSVEVHTEKAKEIVKTVLDKLDTNNDGVLTMREFVAGGVDGLPNFKGVEHLGHHYDAEGEYFLHHEEIYHSTPETQNEANYVHQEDLDHFMDHAHLEEVEDERVREFTGEEDGHHHASFAESDDDKPHAVFHDYADDGSIIPSRMNEPLTQKILASIPVPQAKDGVSREESARMIRAEIARAQAVKFGKEAREASRRGEWKNDEFDTPKDAADRLRKSIPYKFKIRKSWYSL